MRRADRLFQIIQILRRTARPVTAAALAAELEVSTRTVYRDVADLIGQRIPIDGAAGFGYLLAADFDMPPLMLTRDEVEAVVLGAQWVAGRADSLLANAARDVVAKITASVPEHLRPFITEPSVRAKVANISSTPTVDSSGLRAAIHDGHKVHLRYRSEAGEETERTVWPVILGYSDTSVMLIAWCELRQDFRHFRAERIVRMDATSKTTFGIRPGELRRRWERWREDQEVFAKRTT